MSFWSSHKTGQGGKVGQGQNSKIPSSFTIEKVRLYEVEDAVSKVET